jgi:hypothetical protein
MWVFLVQASYLTPSKFEKKSIHTSSEKHTLSDAAENMVE